MDYQNRVGSKFGGGGPASHSATNADRRERLRKLALETIDLDKDPYIFKNHLGSFECRLCLTVHQNDGSYLAHTQGKKHQTNLARRAAREQKEGGNNDNIDPQTGLPRGVVGAGFAALGFGSSRNVFIKIGRPAYKISKVRDPMTRQNGMIFQVEYPKIKPSIEPKWQVMSAYAQKIEAPDPNYQYLIIAAEPYETIAFKIPSLSLDNRDTDRHFSFWDPDSKEYWLQVMFQTEREARFNAAPGLAPPPSTTTTTTPTPHTITAPPTTNSSLPAFPGPYKGPPIHRNNAGPPGFVPTGANAAPIPLHYNQYDRR
ncbi:hypothetical protein QBC37DRAFT_174512 [Rhypophila decipiens]|uniref:Matrin-type domain-containing protein n=1 Tax=Rhypophila decipiens TaxID=261697 RepID=A0AAN6Y8H9_9PEZI|nr:hypothetical protein QBC37DRAFT_174512 [Rhypophila decipiens]